MSCIGLSRGAVEGSYREAAEDSERAEKGSRSLEEMQFAKGSS